eukprot:1885482-Rhodomonas_salina.1
MDGCDRPPQAVARGSYRLHQVLSSPSAFRPRGAREATGDDPRDRPSSRSLIVPIFGKDRG